jgi:hypothetical protein
MLDPSDEKNSFTSTALLHGALLPLAIAVAEADLPVRPWQLEGSYNKQDDGWSCWLRSVSLATAVGLDRPLEEAIPTSWHGVALDMLTGCFLDEFDDRMRSIAMKVLKVSVSQLARGVLGCVQRHQPALSGLACSSCMRGEPPRRSPPHAPTPLCLLPSPHAGPSAVEPRCARGACAALRSSRVGLLGCVQRQQPALSWLACSSCARGEPPRCSLPVCP